MKTRQAAQVLGRLGGSKTSPEKAAAAKINGTQGGRPIKATVNPDGVSIAGCSTIYAPRGQAGEYAPLATNPYRGCGHGCAYCYVPQVLRMDRVEFNAGAFPRPNFLNSLNADARKYQAAGITEQVMLSFTTDPYHPGDHSLTHATITTLRDHGLAFCTLTKGGTRALRDLAYFRPDRDAFASTLTSLDDKFSQKWEPKAALPSDRQVNYLPMTKTTNWHEYTDRMVELCQKLGVKHYIKKDLQPFLPDGYVNIRRMTQHH
jgi:hypothetical protein